jgi:hypothetical protein
MTKKPMRGVRLMMAAAFSLAFSGAAMAADSLFTWDDLQSLKIYHAYSASDGHSYIEEIKIPASVKTIGNAPAELYFDLKPQAIRIGRSKSGALIDWHYAGDSRHIIVPMQGDIVFDLGDGKMFHLKPGEAILAEDWTGKGHRSGCYSDTKPTCVALDILVDANPREMPLRAPPAPEKTAVR